MDQESIPSQPEPVIPPSIPPTKKFSPVLILAAVILLVIVGAGGVFLGKSLNTSPKSTLPTVVPLPTQIPTLAPDETANWKTYVGETVYTTDGSSKFSIKYPPDWDIQGNILYPYKDNKLSQVQLGAGGTEGPENWKGITETINFPAGGATFSWDDTSGEWLVGNASFPADKYSYLFDVMNIPANQNKEMKEIFIKILSTFKFLQ